MQAAEKISRRELSLVQNLGWGGGAGSPAPSCRITPASRLGHGRLVWPDTGPQSERPPHSALPLLVYQSCRTRHRCRALGLGVRDSLLSLSSPLLYRLAFSLPLAGFMAGLRVHCTWLVSCIMRCPWLVPMAGSSDLRCGSCATRPLACRKGFIGCTTRPIGTLYCTLRLTGPWSELGSIACSQSPDRLFTVP